MPPVRWKSCLAVIVCCLGQFVLQTDALQDAISMTADGWRPIVGSKKPNYFELITPAHEVYSTPTPTLTPSPTTTLPPSRKSPIWGAVKAPNIPGRKKNNYLKVNPYITLPTHGPHIPLSAVSHGRPGLIGQLKKYHVKPQLAAKRPKPTHYQTTTHNIRDDMQVATSGSFAVFNRGPGSKLKTREVTGLAVAASSHYTINPPHGHIEFNRFGLPAANEGVFHQYNKPQIQSFLFAKVPQTNDVNYQFQKHNDEYTRNLVPPPLVKKEITNNKNQMKLIPESVVVQVPPPFQFTLQKVNDPAIEVEVTKEKISAFHPPNKYQGEYRDYDFHSLKRPEVVKATYEVSENKEWGDAPQLSLGVRATPTTLTPRNRRPPIGLNLPPFLPTPYKPDNQGVLPTSPTQSEISTVFTKLSQLHRETSTHNPNEFNVKEVSTHYPILGRPVFGFNYQEKDKEANDITTQLIQEEEVITTRRPHRRRRPSPRRTTTTTTTTEASVEMESYEMEKSQENETYEVETEKPRRRPSRYRTTTTPPVSTSDRIATRGRNRYRHRFVGEPKKRIRPETQRVQVEQNYRQPTEEPSTETDSIAMEKSDEVEDGIQAETVELEREPHYVTTDIPKKSKYETIRPPIEIISTTERVPTTNLVVPENEIDSVESEEITTVPTTTTTATPTTTFTSNRIRGRPIKFDNSNRPRFSVKDYRQKLSQYTSTTTQEPQRTTVENVRIRLPSRLKRPTSTSPPNQDDDSYRNKFVPKDPRHSHTSESGQDAIIPEKNVKSVNTRLRPFGRYRSTTSTTATPPKISIKPNLFTRRRPPMLSLKTKIHSKYHRNDTTEKTTTTEEIDTKETRDSTAVYEQDIEPATISSKEDVEVATAGDISKIDSYLYSQRVSDLTSSAKNDYNIPGAFKSVPPTSRRIPNYFTIATDDPILPIEAFFPNIKEKNRDGKDS